MKLFNRVIEQRLRSHLEQIGFINKHQSRFWRAKSTDGHLFRLSQSIMEGFNKGEPVVATFLDVEKAFDNVWHNGLRFKIFQVDLPTKIDTLALWFPSWLCNTSQCKWFIVKLNRPQSRGPTGFCPESITFSDLRQLPSNTAPQIKLTIPIRWWYCRMGFQHKGTFCSKAAKRLQQDLLNLAMWCAKWRIKLNSEKPRWSYSPGPNSPE